jgi:hypothetical protein
MSLRSSFSGACTDQLRRDLKVNIQLRTELFQGADVIYSFFQFNHSSFPAGSYRYEPGLLLYFRFSNTWMLHVDHPPPLNSQFPHPQTSIKQPIMATPNSSLRQRGGQKDLSKSNGKVDKVDELLDSTIASTKEAAPSQWDYKLALALITLLSILTRFWGISHPNEVVFDEVHFGKVCCWTPPAQIPVLTAVVRLVLPPTHILLRCPPSLRKATVRPHGLVCWLRWSLPLR